MSLASDNLIADDADELDRILREELIVSSYQPIVDLRTEEVVGYEALARGPKGSPLEFPDRLFATGRATGRLAELDWECRAAALRGALLKNLRSPMLLFVNVEPDAAFVRPPDHVWPLLDEAGKKLLVVCEFTERGLIDRPTDVLSAARVWRRAGMAIALDDVGADSRSLGILPLLRPDIIKLDMSVVHAPDEQLAETMGTMQTINSWNERNDALVVAEGVEVDAHLARATALGAHFCQGWKYGKPIPLSEFEPAPATRALPLGASNADRFDDQRSPYQFVSAHRETRVATKRFITAISRELEGVARVMGPTGLLLSTFQHARYFDQSSRQAYSEIADDIALVGVIGQQVPRQPESGVLGCSISAGDPLADEWIVCEISPHYCAALVAKDMGDTGPDADRRFSFYLTYDSELVAGVARRLIERVVPLQDRTAPSRLRLAS